MRIRNGFVSNSSSSSFIIYGVMLTDGDMDNIFNKLNIVVEDIYEWIDERTRNAGLEYISDSDNDSHYIGLHPNEIGDDETGSQFKARAYRGIEDILGLSGQFFADNIGDKFDWHEGVVYG